MYLNIAKDLYLSTLSKLEESNLSKKGGKEIIQNIDNVIVHTGIARVQITY